MKILRILFKLVVALVVVVATALGLVYWRSSTLLAQHIDVHEPALTIATDAETLARGERLATTHGCTDCHDKDLGGRVLVDAFPIGRLAAPNLTRGKGGVGGRLDAASAERAIRHGLGEDGRLLLYMPTTDFNALTDADTADLIAYVLAIAPVDRDDRIAVALALTDRLVGEERIRDRVLRQALRRPGPPRATPLSSPFRWP